MVTVTNKGAVYTIDGSGVARMLLGRQSDQAVGSDRISEWIDTPLQQVWWSYPGRDFPEVINRGVRGKA